MENTPPRYSVLLPVHNGAATVEFAIRSALLQTDPDFELLVVGDGCSDHSADVVRGISDARIHWLDLPKAPNRGYANRNRVLRTARGEFIAYLQQDDLWMPDHLELLGACLARPEVDLAYSRPVRVLPDGLLWPDFVNLNDTYVRGEFLSRRGGLGFAEVFLAHHRRCFEAYGYWNEALPTGGDQDLCIRIIMGGGERNFAYVPVPTALHFRQTLLPTARQAQRAAGVEYPPALWLPVFARTHLQQTAWNKLAAAPGPWTAAVREAVQCWLDRQSLQCHMGNHYPPAELAAMTSTAGWRLLSRLRAARWRFFPPGSRRERIWLALLRPLQSLLRD